MAMLQTPIEKLFRLTPPQKTALYRLGIRTGRDLLYYFPSSYSDPSTVHTLTELTEEQPQTVTVFGEILSLDTKKSFRGHIPMAFGRMKDSTGKIAKLVFFNQPYIAKMLPAGTLVSVTGEPTFGKDGSISFSNPECEKVEILPEGATGKGLFNQTEIDALQGSIYATYSETRGITSKWFRHALKRVLTKEVLTSIVDPIPEQILKEFALPKLSTALVWVHAPRTEPDARAARKRFAFEEIFYIQLGKQAERKKLQAEQSWHIIPDVESITSFEKTLGFPLTAGQKKVVHEIFEDFRRPHPMSRLLEGDVGSGKTAIAAIAAFAAITTSPRELPSARLQVAYMCPTEILAKQHFESFIGYFGAKKLGEQIQVGLITSSGCQKYPSKLNPSRATDLSRAQFLKLVKQGEIHILIGTHSLIQESVEFKHLGLVIIDEQHRFGTFQRQKLARKHNHVPHLLSMTATPIPRTLALTLYGDLDLSVLDEMPPGRKRVITEVIAESKREVMYEKLREEIRAGRQAYVICPRINEPDPSKEQAMYVKSVKEEAIRLKKDVFPYLEIGIIHGKMSPNDKDEAMKDFADKKYDILIATSVVEVGVNVPNATVIIIEGGERFGLSQLHQLRGRVIRSTHQAYCYICADIKSKTTVDRLKAISTAKNGFELAEYDLAFRGSGGLYGFKQWGVSDLAMEALKNIKLVEAARSEARKIIEGADGLDTYPLLKERVEGERISVHFE
ncbi:MAG TPA: ATP-dependent DNA helicase RecG [Candidatus Paceibacterota bacterium]|nr:ATP-dependent DNA helicase RecG [Candidatus Paceibacterota bacterium]